jgi:hypothetical protein
MEAVCSSETLATADESTRRQNPEERHPQRRENSCDLLRNELAW